jgi:large subunit ribosomal protein L25
MEKMIELGAELREQRGTLLARGLRSSGLIPAVIYGHKKDTIAITVNAHDFTEAVHHGARLMELKIGNKKENIIIKELQYDHLGKNIIHADLMRVSVTDLVTVTVPVEMKGTAKGAAEGGVTVLHSAQLEVECRVTEIPDKITINIKDLEVDGHIFAKDIQLPEGVKLKSDPETLVISCTTVVEVAVAEEAVLEEAASPEVITKGKKIEEGEEGAVGEEGKEKPEAKEKGKPEAKEKSKEK